MQLTCGQAHFPQRKVFQPWKALHTWSHVCTQNTSTLMPSKMVFTGESVTPNVTRIHTTTISSIIAEGMNQES